MNNNFGGGGNRTRVRKCGCQASTRLSRVLVSRKARPAGGSALRQPPWKFSSSAEGAAASAYPAIPTAYRGAAGRLRRRPAC